MFAAGKAGGVMRGRPAGLQYVGGQVFTGTSDATPLVTVTGLSGGVDTFPTLGDFIVAAVATKGTTDLNLAMVSAGFTEQADLYFNSTNDVQLGVFTKRLTAPEIAFEADLTSSSFPYAIILSVWSGVNVATPMDATPTTVTASGGPPDSPSLTTVTAGAMALAIGACVGDNTNTLTDLVAPSGMATNFLMSRNGNSIALGLAQLARPSAGAYNPAAFTGGTSNAANSSAAVTLALRP